MPGKWKFPSIIVLPVNKSIMVQFYQQLATLISAGFGIVRALNVCRIQTADKRFQEMLLKIHDSIQSGNSLAAALQLFPETFSPFHLGMVKTAERSGTLPDILNNLAKFEEKEMRLISRLKAALAYPVFVTIVAFGIVILLTRYLCPLLNAITQILGPEKIPPITRVLIFMGKCSTDLRYMVPLLLLFILLIITVIKVSKQRKVKYIMGRVKLLIPTLGKLYRKVILIRLCRVLSTLLNSGVPSAISIRVVDEVAENIYFSEAIMKKIIWRIDEGKQYSEAFAESTFFPTVLINMMVVGEQTGKLPYVIDKLADMLEIDVEMFLANFSSLLEPVLIVILGGVTFFILLAAFLPMYTIMSGL
ncbi:MAG: type II secretion system F family protein [Candidatus Xenobiia bacterium LiM19]